MPFGEIIAAKKTCEQTKKAIIFGSIVSGMLAAMGLLFILGDNHFPGQKIFGLVLLIVAVIILAVGVFQFFLWRALKKDIVSAERRARNPAH
jgi:nicotinamide riboside transporter PnuC